MKHFKAFALRALKRELDAYSLDELSKLCQALGQSGRGDRQELTARIIREQKRQGRFDYQQFD